MVASMTVDEDIARDLLRSIRQVVRQIAIHSKQMLRDVGLNVAQIVCLKAVTELENERQEITVADISLRVQLSPATVSRVVDKLVGAGLLTRDRSDTDRRRVSIALTPAGLERIQAMPTPLQETFLHRFGELPQKRQIVLRNALRQVAELMSASDLDAAPLLAPGDDIKD